MKFRLNLKGKMMKKSLKNQIAGVCKFSQNLQNSQFLEFSQNLREINFIKAFCEFLSKFKFKKLNFIEAFCEFLSKFKFKKLNLAYLKSTSLLIMPILWAFAMSGCSLAPSPTQNPTTYILQSDENIVLSKAKTSPKSVQIASTQSVFYLKTNEIIYIKDNELSSYAKHSWKSSPSNALQSILAAKFEKNKLFAVVLNSNSQIKADLLLETRFDRFEQVFTSENDGENESVVVLELSANLIDNNSKKVLGNRHFSYKIKVEQLSPASAANTFNKALNTLCDDVVLWLDGVLD